MFLNKLKLLALHLVFVLPCVLRPSLRVSLYLDYENATLLNSLDFVIHNLDRLLDEIDFNLYLFKGYYKHALGETFLDV